VVAQTDRKLEGQKKTTGWPRLEKLLGAKGTEVVQRVRAWLGLMQASAPGTPGRKGARVLEPFQPFPIHALPGPLGCYVEQGANALGCDPAYLALPALGMAAGMIGYTRVLRLKRTWREFPVVWSLMVGESGTLKSPAYRLATDYLFVLQRRLQLQYRHAYARYQQEMADYDEAKRLAKKDGTDPGDPPQEPVEQIIFTSDATIEALAEIIEDNPRGLLVTCDELTAWFSMFARYQTGKQGGSDLPRWLSMHSAGGFSYHRKTGDRRRIVVPHAAVSVTGGIQPGVLARALTLEFLDAGLAARLLMAMPPKRPKRWSEVEIDPELEQAYQQTIDRLLALDFDTPSGGDKRPHVLRLSAKAKAAWVAFYDSWAQEQVAAEGELAAALSKLEAYAARFALVHHVVSCVWLEVDDRRDVGVESVEAGVTLCRWFAREARRIYRILSESTEDRETRRLVEFLQGRGGKIAMRELMRANCRRYPDAATAESALATLVEAGLARWVEAPTSMKGGKQIKAVQLCMTHDTDDTVPDDEDDDGPGAHDTEPRTGPEGAADGSVTAGTSSDAASCHTEGSGVEPAVRAPSGVIGVMRHARQQAAEWDRDAPGGFGPGEDVAGATGVMRSPVEGAATSRTPYWVVTDPAGLDLVAKAVEHSTQVGLDLETTGLCPRTDRVRLLSLATKTTDGGTSCFLVDCFAVDPRALWEALAGKELVIHNAAFDLAFLRRMGFIPGAVIDTMLVSRVLYAGTRARHGLADCAERELGVIPDKALQKADWSGRLTLEHLAYAARDVEVLRPLLQVFQEKVAAAGLGATVSLEHRCLPAMVWMAARGVGVSREDWSALVRNAKAEAARLREEMNALAPVTPAEMFATWNFDSPADVKKLFAALGFRLENTDDEALAGVGHPLAGLLRGYREATKRTSAYGERWLENIAGDGRVYAHWNQLGSEAGRMSCSEPNLQQLPRDPAYRRCVQAPPGRVLVKADYSQIELRIAAKVCGDPVLLQAYRDGEDLHTRTARAVLGKEEVSKQDRQLAKALNFGLLYGMGARGFAAHARGDYGLELTEGQARGYRSAFFRTYKGLEDWHRGVKGSKAPETRTLGGRRRLIPSADPSKPEAERRKFEAAMDRQRLNTPVQGTGADGLKLALALLWERREEVPGAFPVLAVHDEIVVECDAGQARAVAAWLKKAMVDAMSPLLGPVPVEVEVKVGRTWGGD
jgi:DNA polymerase I-like protein with 3'-5' exonuclease and polymerase domains